MENAVETNMLQESEPVDVGQVPVEDLSTLLTETVADEAQPIEEQTVEDDPRNQSKPSEPGWIKQRVNAAVTKAVAEAEARVAAKYEAMLSPLRESMMDREAEELVQSGEFKSIERAKEYVHLKNGTVMSTEEAQPQQNLPPRDANGRFTSQPENNVDPAVQVRADILAKQANKIKNSRGIDVMQVFNSNPEVKQRVVSGEWDFYDVAENINRVPIPARSSNGGGIPRMSIANMSEKQWEELNSNLDRGRAYTSRKG